MNYDLIPRSPLDNIKEDGDGGQVRGFAWVWVHDDVRRDLSFFTYQELPNSSKLHPAEPPDKEYYIVFLPGWKYVALWIEKNPINSVVLIKWLLKQLNMDRKFVIWGNHSREFKITNSWFASVVINAIFSDSLVDLLCIIGKWP